jgi:UDP-N-acetylmuramoyl-L-alanyl-D-glutamate--2,6-diaminopimelate ligase
VVTEEPAARPLHPLGHTVREAADWIADDLRVPGELLADPVGAARPITGISLSSQRVRPGDLYAALAGARTHGIGFLQAALAAGAVAVLTDHEARAEVPDGVPAIVVERPRSVLGALSAYLYGNPAAALRMIGVTGTQGKTTTTRLAEQGLLGSGVPAGVIGTVGTRIAGRDVKTSLTTPEAPDLHGLFARMVEEDLSACAMEVSSHALVLGRVDGVVFDVAVFLNLGRDHLDFHTDLEDYYQAKAMLFTPERARLGLVCVDDEHGRRLAAEADIPVRTFTLRDRAADWRAVDVAGSAQGSAFTVLSPDGTAVRAGVPMPGEFNVANALAAIAACAEAGHDAAAVAHAIAEGAGVPGRLERVDRGQDFVVVVDYAHKPDALEATLATLRPLTQGAVIVVLGAGGDRDRGKRPLMGETAARLADLVVVTDDNPRSEDPALIRAALLSGARAGGGAAEVLEVGDRREAIRTAISRAGPGDVVLVAGKGHETGQEVGGTTYPFDDRVVVAEELTR